MKTIERTLTKVVRIGTVPKFPNSVGRMDVFCKIEIKDGRLSICGVEGPMSNGNAYGSCGQIEMHLREQQDTIEPAPGWTRELLAQFFATWDKWHLNDMRAGCEHQRDWDTSKKIEVVSYGLTTEASQLRRDSIHRAAKYAATGQTSDLSKTETALVLLDDWYKDKHAPPDADSLLSGCYEVKKREEKSAGWVRPDEHPDGFLCKPCPVCGYKYGSQWLREELPDVVIEFLASLPDTDKTPAWV